MAPRRPTGGSGAPQGAIPRPHEGPGCGRREPDDRADSESQRVAEGGALECLDERRDEHADLGQVDDLRQRVPRTGQWQTGGSARRHDQHLPDAQEEPMASAWPDGTENR